MKRNLLFSFLFFSTVVCFAADDNRRAKGAKDLLSVLRIDDSGRTSTEIFIAEVMKKVSEGLSKEEAEKLLLLSLTGEVRVDIQPDGTTIVNRQPCTCPACDYERSNVQSATSMSDKEGKRKRDPQEDEGR